MSDYPSCRSFLRTAAAGPAFLAAGGAGWLTNLPPVSAAEADRSWRFNQRLSRTRSSGEDNDAS
jgi:hypothetical protein